MGNLGRKWLEAADKRIFLNNLQVCFNDGLMLSAACDREVNTVFVLDVLCYN